MQKNMVSLPMVHHLNRSRRDVQTLFVADTYGDLGLSSKQSWLRAFESEVASYLCVQDSLFTPSGVMAQEMALCIYRERKYSGDAMLRMVYIDI